VGILFERHGSSVAHCSITQYASKVEPLATSCNLTAQQVQTRVTLTRGTNFMQQLWYVGQTSRTLKLRYQEHTRYIKNNDPKSAYALHILHNRHKYGPIYKTMTLLKPLSNTSLLTPNEQYYIHALHKEGKLIPEQCLGDPNPLLLLAIDPSQPLTLPWQLDTNSHTVHKTTHRLLTTTATTPR